MFCFTGLCQDVAAAMVLAVEVVSAIMNLEIITAFTETQKQLENLFKPADESAAESVSANDVPVDESAAEAVPAGEEIPAAVEVGEQSAATTWYACLTNCSIRRGIRKTSSTC